MENYCKFVIKPELTPEEKAGVDLMATIRKGLMTPDVIAVMRAGCSFEVFTVEGKESVKVMLRSREKVSILRDPNGVPISVLVKKTDSNFGMHEENGI